MKPVSFPLCVVLCATHSAAAFQLPRPVRACGDASPTQLGAGLQQFAPQAVSLFNNMKTPSAIIAGAIVPLGLLAPLPLRNPAEEESAESNKTQVKIHRALRMIYVYAAVFSFASELLTVIWATVATNQLIETAVAPAESVWHLLQRDYNLEWAATNAHFVSGLLGFLVMVGIRGYFNGGAGILGRSAFGTAASALMLMTAVVNRGVAKGSGTHSYGASVLSLFRKYVCLLWGRATCSTTFGILEVASLGFLLYSAQSLVRSLWVMWKEE